MQKLSGPQYKQLQDVLLDAFPTPAALAQMVRTGLDENLHAIVGGASLSVMVFELIQWVEARGRRKDLLVAALQAIPGNEALVRVAGEMLPAGTLPAGALPAGALPASPTSQSASQPVAPFAPAALRRAVVLTALRLEFRAVREQLTDVREATDPQVGTVFDVGRLASDKGDWEVALFEMGPGNVNAAIETDRAIQHFGAKAVVFVGVAGGLKDVKRGDVVAATKVYGYESGKDTAEGFRPRPELGMGGYALLQRAKAEARGDAWVARVKGSPPDGVEAYIGPIAAGEKVLANKDSELVRFIRAHYGDALAVEMEGHGVMQAAHQRNVEALVVRGISDLIDAKAQSDAEGWQPRAAKHAAAFAMQVLAKL